jgi:hypothetical protein
VPPEAFATWARGVGAHEALVAYASTVDRRTVGSDGSG